MGIRVYGFVLGCFNIFMFYGFTCSINFLRCRAIFLGFMVYGLRLLEFRVRVRVSGFGFRIWGLGSGVWVFFFFFFFGLGFFVLGFGFMVLDLGFQG